MPSRPSGNGGKVFVEPSGAACCGCRWVSTCCGVGWALFDALSCLAGGSGGSCMRSLAVCAPAPAAQPTNRAVVAMPAIGFRGVAREEEGWRNILNMMDYLAQETAQLRSVYRPSGPVEITGLREKSTSRPLVTPRRASV